MFTFAEIPAWSSFWTYKIAAIKYKFGDISASNHPINVFQIYKSYVFRVSMMQSASFLQSVLHKVGTG